MTHIELAQLSCLVVDDDPFMLTTIGKILESIGVGSVMKTDNATDALRHLANRSNHIDIVISDLNMPHMDGIQLLRHFGNLGSTFGIVLISGEDPRLLESVKSLGEQQKLSILGTLSKPVSRQDLSDVLSKYQPQQYAPPSGPAAMVFADELQQAILHDELEVFFQPQVSMDDGRVVGLEALARWNHAEKGWIPPPIFIGIAEKYNMIAGVTDRIFQMSIAECCRLRRLGFDYTISVNFSSQVFNSLDLPETISETLQGSDVEPSQVVVEVTESSLAHDMRVSLDILTRLRLKGFHLSIDDFGTGFSSLEQLKQIPFTELKIDRSFVHQAADNQASRAILESSIELAKKLNITCVAEGVETEADWKLVKQLGCDVVQGYFIARPMPSSEYINWANNYEQRRSLVAAL